MSRRLVLWLLLVLWPLSAWGATWLASPGGGGTCSTSTPSSVSAAIGCAQPGDTVQLQAGTYSTRIATVRDGTSTNRITIAGVSNATVIIKPSFGGAGQGALISVPNAFITFDQLTVDGTTYCQDGANNLFKIDVGSHHVRVSNSILKNCQALDASGTPKSASKGILLVPGSDNNEFMNNEIANNWGYGIYANAANMVIDNNFIHDNRRFGIHMYSDSGGSAVHDNIVRNNRIISNGNNTVCATCSECAGCTQSGMVLIGPGHRIYNNVFATNFGGGIQMDADSPGIYNNTIHGNAEACIFGAGSGADMTNNICSSNGSGIASGIGTQKTTLTSNPGFVNTAGGDYHLAATATTAINQGASTNNAGTALSTFFTTDFDTPPTTRPQGGQWDIGADEVAADPPNTFFVAKTGLDTNAGTSAAPWLTIQKCAQTATNGQTCVISAGTYRETVTPTSNGITFQPNGSDVVTVSGADLVTGWSVHSGSIWKSTSKTWTLGKTDDQVFVDGVMMNLAREPDASLDISRPTWFTADSFTPSKAQADANDAFTPWTIDDSALTQPNNFWNGGLIVHLADGKWAQAGNITSYSTGHVVFTPHNTSQQRMELGGTSGLRFYLLGVLGALDVASEWYYDSGTTTLYLQTPASDNPTGHTVEAKRRPFAFDLSGRSNITIKNLKIFAASINMNTASSGHMLDGLDMKYVWHSYNSLPDSGIGQNDVKWSAWNRGVRLVGTNHTLKNCTIHGSSHNGVSVRGTGHVIDNCTIHDVNYMHAEGGGVGWMGDDPGGNNPNCGNITVKNSTIYNSGRMAINSYYCTSFVITHNDLHHFCIDVGDAGCWYTSKGGATGEVSYNHCHDTEATFLRFGIYMDADPQGYTIHHNVVWNVSYGINVGEPVDKSRVNNNLYNNTIWFASDTDSITGPSGSAIGQMYNNLLKSGINIGGDQQNNMQVGSGNPGFVDVNNFNFQLTSSSPAVNNGRVISGITTNAVGTPDVGAYEFGATPWTAGATGTPTPPSCPPGCTCTLDPQACDPPPATGGPIAWWKLDDGTGTTAVDSTSNGHTGTLQNGPTWVSGQRGGAVHFDGVDDVITLPDAVLSGVDTDHTVCFWLKPDNIAQADQDTFKQTMVNLQIDASNGLRLTAENTGPPGSYVVALRVGGTPVVRQTTSAVLANGTWTHLCHTQASGTITVYANGVAQTIASVGEYTVGAGTLLGGRLATSGHTVGTLDDIKIWNRALSATEIQTEFAPPASSGSAVARHRRLTN